LILENEMRSTSDQTCVTTDDGSYGAEGFVTDALKEILSREEVNMVVAVGPPVMMRAVVKVTRPEGVPTIVSLNPIMIDGTGMCGGCRVTVGGQRRFVCVDGPEFDGHQVDFDELMTRLKVYENAEKISLEHMGTCRLEEQ
jgi:ferredoxin--NADP+ reductase